MATAKKVAPKATPKAVKTDSKPLSNADMLKKISALREEADDLKRNMHMGDVQNVRAYKFKRRELARMLTALNKKSSEGEEK